ncbi:MAG: SDR family oxidoreductase [Xanthobacteraceae bacterium]
MRVLITGAYGLIGSACTARLSRDDHAVVGVGREVSAARRSFPDVRWIAADVARLDTPAAWRPLLADIDAVVNCVGVLQDGIRDSTRDIHVTATCALFDACAEAGIRRVVHVSAVGAAPDGPSAFSHTKAQAEAHLATLDLDWVILRPALVISPIAYGGTAMLRGLAGIPLLTPVIAPDAPIQVVSAHDVAETVAFALGPAAPGRVTWDLAHPQTHRLAEIVVAIRQWLGWPSGPLVALPDAITRLMSFAADVLGWLGWRSPARSTAVAQLTAGVVGEPLSWIAATGIKPQSLRDILAAHPAGVQERWFARLYLLKPVAILVLALFWFATGVIALGPGRASSLAHLHAAGVHAPLDQIILIGGAIFDIVLGFLLLVRRAARMVLITMLAVTPFYVLTGTLLAPELWADPLGPLTKIGPLMIATLFTLAILDER